VSNLGAVKLLCSARCIREPYSPPTEALNFGAVKWIVVSTRDFIQRALSGAVDIVHDIALLLQALFYGAGCSTCWSINLRPRAKPITFLDIALDGASVGDALIN
jgi:hypothetical protein